MNSLKACYLKLFTELNDENIKNHSYSQWQAHCLLISVLSTGILMWSYAILAGLTIRHPTPFIVGVLASAIHLISPLILAKFRSITLATNMFIGAGMAHQFTFSYYSGGFLSPIIIWFGILPMIAGVVDGKKGVITWSIMTTIVSVIMLTLHLNGHAINNYLTPKGFIIAHCFIVFGWIFLSTIIISTFVIFRNSHEQQILDNKSRIESLNRILCHDIANPLSNIKFRVELLKKSSSDEIKGLDKINRSIERIVDIINQARFLESFNVGKVKYTPQVVNLQNTLQEIFDQFHAKLTDKQITIDYNRPDYNICAIADESLFFNQVLSNIVSNAIKFSPPNSKISVTLKKSKDGHAVIQVKDFGEGIPPYLMEKIYNISEKTSRLGTKGEVGTGFGLPIADSIIKAMNGAIKVESQVKSDTNTNSWTEFSIYLPMEGEQ